MQTQRVLQAIVLACLTAVSFLQAPLFSETTTSDEVIEEILTKPVEVQVENQEREVLAKATKQQKRVWLKQRKKITKAEKNLRKNMPKDAIAKCWPGNNCIMPSLDGQHFIHDRSPTGTTLEIENGAVFVPREWDAYKIADMLKNSEIRLTNNSGGSYGYEFKIVNVATGVSAQANISLAPYKASPHTRRIYFINPATNSVTLDNGRNYIVSNLNTISGWKGFGIDEYGQKYAGDMIIVGDNDSWWTRGYNAVLFNLNVKTNTSVTAYSAQ